MEHGRVVQVGRHEDLISTDGRYRELYYQEEKSSREEYAWKP
jgi:hypothetical protein